jgi:hypothetical protein
MRLYQLKKLGAPTTFKGEDMDAFAVDSQDLEDLQSSPALSEITGASWVSGDGSYRGLAVTFASKPQNNDVQWYAVRGGW